MLIRYTTKLTKTEVEEIRVIINKGSHTSSTFLENPDKDWQVDNLNNEQLALF